MNDDLEFQRNIQKDVEAVMKKYDKESNVRIWEGTPKQITRFLSVAFSLYCIWVTLFSTAMPEVRLNIFLGLILIMGYLNYPMLKHHVKPNHIPWYDIIIMLCGVIPFFDFAWNAQSIIKLALRVTSPRNPNYHLMVTMAILAILSTMELCRRCVGIPILCVVGALMVYAFSTVRFGKVIYDLYYSTGDGLRSTPIE